MFGIDWSVREILMALFRLDGLGNFQRQVLAIRQWDREVQEDSQTPMGVCSEVD